MLNIKYSNIKFDITDNHHISDAVNFVTNGIENQKPFFKALCVNNIAPLDNHTQDIVHKIRDQYSDILVIGMGGAILNPQSVIELITHQTLLNVHFINNTDPLYLQNLLSKVNLQSCAIVVISNSGETIETVSLVKAVIFKFHILKITNFGQQFYFITNTHSSRLHSIAQEIGGAIIPHLEQISGRYSGLSNVTTFLAMILGINIKSYIKGANLMLENFMTHGVKSQSALSAISIYQSNKTMMINIGYLQQFAVFLEWYSQIIAESLGKNGKGITPIRGLGPNDQHSMMQLYLDGPQDKIYSMFYVNQLPNTHTEYMLNYAPRIEELNNVTLTEMNQLHYESTLQVLIDKGLPVRSILLHDLSAQTIGALVAHSMLEIIILGHLMSIDPFTQPAVELIKQKLRERL